MSVFDLKKFLVENKITRNSKLFESDDFEFTDLDKDLADKLSNEVELKIGDTIKRQGIKFTVQNIEQETYKNGTPSLLISCTANNSKVVDSFFHFKLSTKVK